MAELVSSWASTLQSVPETHIMPLEKRPTEQVQMGKEIPVIDFSHLPENRSQIVAQILQASQDYGFFQVINHGVPEELMEDAMRVYKQVFDLPVEEKEKICSAEGKASTTLEKLPLVFTSAAYGSPSEKHKFWRDAIQHNCNTPEDLDSWPDNPPRYRQVIGLYSSRVRELSVLILELISEGLGLEKGCLSEGLGQRMVVNHYPRCPDPSLTLGLRCHCDPNLISLLQQDIYGLQFLKDNHWIGVQPIPHAFVVNVGLTLTVISNGRLKSCPHRAVTNSMEGRTSIGTFILVVNKVIEPAKVVVGPSSPPLFKSFAAWEDFFTQYSLNKSPNEAPLDPFKLN